MYLVFNCYCHIKFVSGSWIHNYWILVDRLSGAMILSLGTKGPDFKSRKLMFLNIEFIQIEI